MIRVHRPPTSRKSSETDDYPDAVRWDIIAGGAGAALYLPDRLGQQIAAYAPGQWTHVQRLDDAPDQ